MEEVLNLSTTVENVLDFPVTVEGSHDFAMTVEDVNYINMTAEDALNFVVTTEGHSRFRRALKIKQFELCSYMKISLMSLSSKGFIVQLAK